MRKELALLSRRRAISKAADAFTHPLELLMDKRRIRDVCRLQARGDLNRSRLEWRVLKQNGLDTLEAP